MNPDSVSASIRKYLEFLKLKNKIIHIFKFIQIKKIKFTLAEVLLHIPLLLVTIVKPVQN